MEVAHSFVLYTSMYSMQVCTSDSCTPDIRQLINCPIPPAGLAGSLCGSNGALLPQID
jgi:hypothetical protein